MALNSYMTSKLMHEAQVLHVCCSISNATFFFFKMANGRVVYVDHRNRRTQWERPTVASQRQQASNLDSERRRMAYTMARRNPGEEASKVVTPAIGYMLKMYY